MRIELATPPLENVLYAIDSLAQSPSERREFLERSVAAQNCWIALTGESEGVGYVVLDYSFFGNGFVSLLHVRSDARRQGIGRALMQHMETVCRTPKLFTSTNLSNAPMQTLLLGLGYVMAGVVHHLDKDDPELFFVKYLSLPNGTHRMEFDA